MPMLVDEFCTLVAAPNADAETVLDVLKEQSSVEFINTPDSKTGCKPLAFAATYGNLNVFLTLLKAGASLKSVAPWTNILGCAAQNPDPRILNYLVNNTKDILKHLADGTNEAHLLVYSNNIDAAVELLKQSPMLNTKGNEFYETPLTIAKFAKVKTAFSRLQNELDFYLKNLSLDIFGLERAKGLFAKASYYFIMPKPGLPLTHVGFRDETAYSIAVDALIEYEELPVNFNEINKRIALCLLVFTSELPVMRGKNPIPILEVLKQKVLHPESGVKDGFSDWIINGLDALIKTLQSSQLSIHATPTSNKEVKAVAKPKIRPEDEAQLIAAAMELAEQFNLQRSASPTILPVASSIREDSRSYAQVKSSLAVSFFKAAPSQVVDFEPQAMEFSTP